MCKSLPLVALCLASALLCACAKQSTSEVSPVVFDLEKPQVVDEGKGLLRPSPPLQLESDIVHEQPKPVVEQPNLQTLQKPVEAKAKPAVENAQNGLKNPHWQDLQRRFALDGLKGAKVDAYLNTLGPLTQAAMGRLVRATYKRKMTPPKPTPTAKPAPSFDPNIIKEHGAEKCKAFIKQHADAFAKAEARFSVPASISAALLFVETRLGAYLGDVPENAFQILASLAESRRPEDIPVWIAKMSGVEKQDWLLPYLEKKANWAYAEAKALLQYMLKTGLGPERFSSSSCGAIGLCQFMPSNLIPYGADGSGDGIIDLFDVRDATMSIARFLSRHGWKAGITREQQHKILVRYNHSEFYANTILVLSDLINKK